MARTAQKEKLEPGLFMGPDPTEPRELQLTRVFGQVVALLVDLDPYDRERVLRAVEAIYPAKLTVRPSPNVGGLP